MAEQEDRTLQAERAGEWTAADEQHAREGRKDFARNVKESIEKEMGSVVTIPEATIDAAAKAIYMRHFGVDWDNETEEVRGLFQRDATAALEAAADVTSGVTEEAVTAQVEKLIESTEGNKVATMAVEAAATYLIGPLLGALQTERHKVELLASNRKAIAEEIANPLTFKKDAGRA